MRDNYTDGSGYHRANHKRWDYDDEPYANRGYASFDRSYSNYRNGQAASPENSNSIRAGHKRSIEASSSSGGNNRSEEKDASASKKTKHKDNGKKKKSKKKRKDSSGHDAECSSSAKTS